MVTPELSDYPILLSVSAICRAGSHADAQRHAHRDLANLLQLGLCAGGEWAIREIQIRTAAVRPFVTDVQGVEVVGP